MLAVGDIDTCSVGPYFKKRNEEETEDSRFGYKIPNDEDDCIKLRGSRHPH